MHTFVLSLWWMSISQHCGQFAFFDSCSCSRSCKFWCLPWCRHSRTLSCISSFCCWPWCLPSLLQDFIFLALRKRMIKWTGALLGRQCSLFSFLSLWGGEWIIFVYFDNLQIPVRPSLNNGCVVFINTEIFFFSLSKF